MGKVKATEPQTNQVAENFKAVQKALIDANGMCSCSVEEKFNERRDIFETWLVCGKLVCVWRLFHGQELAAFEVFLPAGRDNRMDTTLRELAEYIAS